MKQSDLLQRSVSVSGASQAEWFFMKAKVALAVAVIKNKPPGMSGRAYAEALACKLKSQDESWKEKAQGLQQEVLRLRQEMLIARATSNTKSSTEAGDDDNKMDDTSQDLFGPESQVWSVEPDSETPELLLQPPEPTIPLPRPLPPSSLHGNPREDALSPPVQFLQSLCALHRVEDDNRGLEALWFIPGDDAGSVLADTVCQLLDSVVTAFKDPPAPGPRDLVLQACQAAARAMDLFCSQRLPSVEFMRRVEEPLRELTRMLLHGSQPSRLQAAEKLMECLIALGSSSMSKSFLIRHILSEISTLADQLWQAFQAQDGSGLNKFPVDQYQNSCHLFSILEALLQKSKVSCRLEVGSEQMAFLSHLEQRAFLLSDEFPLFSIRMWRIGGLLKSSD
ncbi:meiosis-specific protein MEI4 [Stegastes partitus]|uniref:Meiosis-specific protein MEI4 n=1 Tax=Stegastes partitus TaxID=144197 RepID=A0A9Y4N6Z7_9TELE|nr:PREDICTED: meiosis-specific protein MEI4-like [Stegastes partitus]